jgi:beta-N-acetylhexosaminidase
MTARAFITGVAGPALTANERAFLREARPWGLILFARNIENSLQVTALVDQFRASVGRGEAPVLIDQEGGRVQRLGPPQWPAYPAGAVYGELYQRNPALGIEAARLGARLIASDLAALGITVDCLPIADVPIAGADAVIGDRAYGDTPHQVAALAAAVAAGLMAGGVLPVVKHMPGHGRATADSHARLPVVATDRNKLELTDFAAFMPLADLPLGMTAHVVFTAIDPGLPATTSVTIIQEVIRGLIGFAGALMSDDLSMGALSGSLAARTQRALSAGCDLILHCNGQLAEMEEVAANCPVLSGAPLTRAERALGRRSAADSIDLVEARACFARLLAGEFRTVTGTVAG